MTTFYDFIYWLQDTGTLDVLLPFVLIFTIVYSIFSKTGILGNKRYNVVVSIVIAFVFVVPHILSPGSEYDFVPLINNFIPGVAAIIVVGLLFIMMLALFDQDIAQKNIVKVVAPIVAIIVFVIILGYNIGWWYQLPPFLDWLLDPETQMILVTIIIFFVVAMWITGGEEDEGKSKGNSKGAKEFLDWLFSRRENK